MHSYLHSLLVSMTTFCTRDRKDGVKRLLWIQALTNVDVEADLLMVIRWP